MFSRGKSIGLFIYVHKIAKLNSQIIKIMKHFYFITLLYHSFSLLSRISFMHEPNNQRVIELNGGHVPNNKVQTRGIEQQ